MSQSKSRSSVRLLVALAAMTALMAVSVASASAAQITKVTPNPVAPPTVVNVEGTEFGGFEVGNLAAGVCTEQPISGVPACGLFTKVEVNGSGVLTAALNVESATIPNAHSKIPGHPASFNCEEVNCGVAIAYHPKEGKQSFIDYEPLTFE